MSVQWIAGRRLVRALAPLLLVAASGCATLLAPATAPGPSPRLTAGLDSIFADTAFAHAFWGVEFRSAESGVVLYERNAGRNFVPASNMKILTGAAVLEALGPEYRFSTRILAGGPIDGGVLRGPLVIRANGDPTHSVRFHEEARDPIRSWADSLRAHGISRIAGGIIGVDSAFAGPTLGSGWSWDDLAGTYAAEYGALQFNEGVIGVQIVPSRQVGDPAIVILEPATQYVQVNNQTRTVPPGGTTSIAITRDDFGPGITVSGTIVADTTIVQRQISVRDPARYFLAVVRETLRESGIAVEGQSMLADEWPEDARRPLESLVFTYESQPLREILPAMMKPSQNWIAETLLHALALEMRGTGTAPLGAAVADSMFVSWGLNTDNIRYADGSGLSRYNLVSPGFITDLLAHMSRSPNRDVWHASLPVAGVDGTLAGRMTEPPLRGNVHAKTGTLSGVRSLSGYLTTADGERILFSTMVNNHRRSAAGADRVVESALGWVVGGAR